MSLSTIPLMRLVNVTLSGQISELVFQSIHLIVLIVVLLQTCEMGGKLYLKLNTGTRLIANKYHEGKMKSTLKRVKQYMKLSGGK